MCRWYLECSSRSCLCPCVCIANIKKKKLSGSVGVCLRVQHARTRTLLALYMHVHVHVGGRWATGLLYGCDKARRRKPLSNVTASLSVAFKHNRRRKCHHLKGLLHFKTLAALFFFPSLPPSSTSFCSSPFIAAFTENFHRK